MWIPCVMLKTILTNFISHCKGEPCNLLITVTTCPVHRINTTSGATCYGVYHGLRNVRTRGGNHPDAHVYPAQIKRLLPLTVYQVACRHPWSSLNQCPFTHCTPLDTAAAPPGELCIAGEGKIAKSPRCPCVPRTN